MYLSAHALLVHGVALMTGCFMKRFRSLIDAGQDRIDPDLLKAALSLAPALLGPCAGGTCAITLKPGGLLAAGGPDEGVGGAEDSNGPHPEGSCQVGDPGVVADKEGGAAQQGGELPQGEIAGNQIGGPLKTRHDLFHCLLIGRALYDEEFC
jgi:hypothetical protein